MAKDKISDGRLQGTMSAGVSHPEAERVMTAYLTLDNDDARGAFADKMVVNLADRLGHTWPILYHLLEIIRDKKIYEHPALVEGGKTYATFEDYFVATLKQPFAKWDEMEKTYHFVETIMPEYMRKPLEEATAERVRYETKADVRPGNPTGSNQHQKKEQAPATTPGEKMESGKLPDSTQERRAERNGVSPRTQRTLDRLSRDRPDLLEKVNAGEMKPYKAAKQAGIVKTPTPLDILRRAWAKATEDERRAFLADDPTGFARLVAPLLSAEEWEALRG